MDGNNECTQTQIHLLNSEFLQQSGAVMHDIVKTSKLNINLDCLKHYRKINGFLMEQVQVLLNSK